MACADFGTRVNRFSVYRPSGVGLRGAALGSTNGCWRSRTLDSKELPMELRVVVGAGGHRLCGDGPVTGLANAYLAHLQSRGFAPGTVRGYAFDLLNFCRFLGERGLSVDDVVPSDLFDWLDWQAKRKPKATGKVVRLEGRRGAAPATMNRRVAAVRGLFEYAVITGARDDNPVPPGRRSTGLRARQRGMLGHLGGRRARADGRLVRQDRRLPESIDVDDVAAFVADLDTHRDRAIVLAMVLGGLRAAEVRGLLLANVDMGLRQLRLRG
jgi:integrase/recombinase XerC